MPVVPTQRMHSSTIHTAGASVAMKPVMMAGDAMKPSDMEKPEIEFAQPRILSSARLVSKEPIVGEKTVSPTPNRAVKARTWHHNQARDGRTGQERSHHGEGDPRT